MRRQLRAYYCGCDNCVVVFIGLAQPAGGDSSTRVRLGRLLCSATVSARAMVFNASKVVTTRPISGRKPCGLAGSERDISGETTGGGLARLPGVLDEIAPKIVIVELGGNDGLRGYPVQKMKDNLLRILELSHAQGASTLLAEMQIPPNYGRRYTEAFSKLQRGRIHRKYRTDSFFAGGSSLTTRVYAGRWHPPTAVAQPLIVDAVLPHLLPLVAVVPLRWLEH